MKIAAALSAFLFLGTFLLVAADENEAVDGEVANKLKGKDTAHVPYVNTS